MVFKPGDKLLPLKHCQRYFIGTGTWKLTIYLFVVAYYSAVTFHFEFLQYVISTIIGIYFCIWFCKCHSSGLTSQDWFFRSGGRICLRWCSFQLSAYCSLIRRSMFTVSKAALRSRLAIMAWQSSSRAWAMMVCIVRERVDVLLVVFAICCLKGHVLISDDVDPLWVDWYLTGSDFGLKLVISCMLKTWSGKDDPFKASCNVFPVVSVEVW